ncbi:MAG: hypothetical protein O7D94_11445, partial [Planctomycetota bacterium]|nr:hypothetical protein [Planctomycetota bacterium]
MIETDWKPENLRGAVARPLPIVILVLVCGIPSAHARSMQPSVLSTQPATAPAQTQPSRGISLRQHLEIEFATAPTTTDKTHAAIALARCILVTECAPSLNCLLAGRDDCGNELGSLVDQAQEYLKVAAGHLKEPDAQIEADRRVQLDERIEMLGSFAGVFGELAKPVSDEDAYRSTLLEACGELAIYLDDTNAGIVESARLWQGVAYRRAKRFDRAIQVLRPVITQPAFVRIGVHARLQRCHALG